MNYVEIPSIKHANGKVLLPGSKSISTRILLLSALAHGITEIDGLLDSDDIHYMLESLSILGIQYYKNQYNGRLIVFGSDGTFPVKQAKLFLGNAGIVFRSLSAALAISNGQYDLFGTPRMHERPIGDLVDALRQVGADIRYIDRDGYPPISIYPSEVRINQEISVRGNVSSQFLTSLLLTLPMTGADVILKVDGQLVSKPYVVMTIRTMERFGITVKHDDYYCSFQLSKEQKYISPGVVNIEGDASSASYFLAAGAIGGGPVRVEGVGCNSIQGDIQFAEILTSMGAKMTIGDEWIEIKNENKLKSIDRDLNHIPDAGMTLAIVALFAEGTTTIRNVGTWRVKETDRLVSMAIELRKLGAIVEEGVDYISITPPDVIRSNVHIETYGDHRMAMSFALVAVGGIPVRIMNPECVSKTYPDYFQDLTSISY